MIEVVVLDDVLVVERAVLELVLVLVVVMVASHPRSSRMRHAPPPFARASNGAPRDVLVTVGVPASAHLSNASHCCSPLQACMHEGYASGLLHLSAHLP